MIKETLRIESWFKENTVDGLSKNFGGKCDVTQDGEVVFRNGIVFGERGRVWLRRKLDSQKKAASKKEKGCNILW